MASGFHKTADTFVPGSKTLPGRYYTSPEQFIQDIERIYSQRWVCVGRTSQVANPGDYFLCQIGPESLIVVRDQSGELQAYYNVCRHRGTRLCTQEQGKFSATIQCPYHAWTYNLQGHLIGAPLMDEVTNFNKADYPLVKAHLATWGGFLYLSLSPQPTPLETAFQPFRGKFDPWSLAELVSVRKIEYLAKANWKLIVQNYSECYHCPMIHPELVKKTYYRSGQNDLHEGPFLGGFMEFNAEIYSMTISGRTCATPFGRLGEVDLSRAYYYSLFPNLLLSLHPDYVMCHILWPQSEAETRIVCEWLFAPGAIEQPGFNPQDAVEFWDMTNRQDWQVSELTQLGMGSRAYQPSPYSSTESLLAAFDREYLSALLELNAF